MLQVVEKWEAVTEVDVQTPLEVYQELKGEQPPCPVNMRYPALLDEPTASSCHLSCLQTSGAVCAIATAER